ncbi:MAG: type VI secretion system tip protein VgrG, partial [Halomonas sp.]|nr:type VI secretion system tip protein VgrG [Halomonas sp.]
MRTMNGLQFTLQLAGADSADLAVVDFTLEEALSQPFTLTLRFASRDGSLAASDILDRPVSLTIWQDGEVLRRVHAIVSEFG